MVRGGSGGGNFIGVFGGECYGADAGAVALGNGNGISW